MSFSGAQRTRLGAYGATRAPYGTFTGKGEAPPDVVVTTRAGGIGHYKKYPRRLFVDGQVVLVRNAEEERRLLAALAERADEQARIAQALGDEQIAQIATKKSLKLKKRAVNTDDREAQWMDYLRNEDEEILTILLH